MNCRPQKRAQAAKGEKQSILPRDPLSVPRPPDDVRNRLENKLVLAQPALPTRTVIGWKEWVLDPAGNVMTEVVLRGAGGSHLQRAPASTPRRSSGPLQLLGTWTTDGHGNLDCIVSGGYSGSVCPARGADGADDPHMNGHRTRDSFTLSKSGHSCVSTGCKLKFTYHARDRLRVQKRTLANGTFTEKSWELDPAGNITRGLADEAAQMVRNAQPVGSALKSDALHRAPSFVVDDIAKSGTVFNLPNEATLIQMPGEVNGISGRYEWIVDGSGRLTHQLFVKGGSINGVPIKP